MNKTQLFTLSSALLASTALTGGASAGTIGKFASADNAFTTTSLSISNTIFSTAATTANSVLIGEGQAYTTRFGMRYNNTFAGTTRWTTEFTITGAQFVTANLSVANVTLLLSTTSNTTTVIGSVSGLAACTSLTSLVELLVANDCAITGAATGTAIGLGISGVTFNNASVLATAGSAISLTGRVYNPTNPSQIFEASTSGTIITSRAPFAVTVTPGANQTASATTTPMAFTALSDVFNNTTMTLATISVTGSGVLDNGLVTTVGATVANTTSLTVASSIFSSGAVRNVTVGGTTYSTATNFSGGSVTFSSNDAAFDTNLTLSVQVQFFGTTAIPTSAAGTVTGTISGGMQSIAVAGTTAAVSQAGFRAEVNTFNASTNGPFGSYLRVHNNGNIAGTVTITVRNDATGLVLGSGYTTAVIAPSSTVQFSALTIENGANVPTADRVGSYTLNITGPLTGYVQHILFDGNSVADLSGYRNSGVTTNQP